jgi:F-type H+-transporting ATPase subunit b
MLDIDFGLMLISATIFLTMMWILNKILYIPIFSFMKQRDKSIKHDLNNAEDNNNYVDELNKEANSIIEEARLKVNSFKEESINKEKENAKKETSRHELKIKKEHEIFLKSLNSAKIEYKNALLSQLPLFKNSVKNKILEI